MSGTVFLRLGNGPFTPNAGQEDTDGDGVGDACGPIHLLFIRGDANGDDQLNLVDPIYLMEFLFLGRASPPCMDAADTTDDGRVELNDSIRFLSFFFIGADPPPPPYPNPGLDPTEDGLESCLVEG